MEEIRRDSADHGTMRPLMPYHRSHELPGGHDGSRAAAPPVRPSTSAPTTGAIASRWRVFPLLRRTVALSLVALAIWWLVVPMLFPMAGEAVVNASLVQVRAPIEGVTTELRLRVGDRVQAEEPMLRLANAQVDAAQLSKLHVSLAEVIARQQRLQAELREAETAEATYRKSAQTYRDGRTALLQAKLRETKALAEAAECQRANAATQAERSERLAAKQVIATADRDAALENAAVAQKRVAQLKASLALTTIELDATDQGIFLQTETPYCVRQAEELALKLPLLRSQLRETDELRAALEPEVAREEKRVQSLSHATAQSPVSGIVWNCHGNLGQVVKHNEAVYQVADTKDIFVEALLHQRHLGSIEMGGEATIVLPDGTVRQGRVRAIQAAAAADQKALHAIKLTTDDTKQIAVLIDLETSEDTSLLIGRHARVLIARANPGLLDHAVASIFSWVGR